MADTARSLAEIYALLADNTTGQISAQDVRDMLKTIVSGDGEISITSASATTISDTTTFFPVAGTWTLSVNANDWDMNTNGQLRYVGTPDRLCHVLASASFTAASANQVLYIAIAKNGTAITSSEIRTKINTGSDVAAVSLHAFTSVSTNDYLTLVVRNTSSATDVTMETGNVFADSMAK